MALTLLEIGTFIQQSPIDALNCHSATSIWFDWVINGIALTSNQHLVKIFSSKITEVTLQPSIIYPVAVLPISGSMIRYMDSKRECKIFKTTIILLLCVGNGFDFNYQALCCL